MKSNLFKKLASMAGINWFNHTEKIEHKPKNFIPPNEFESHDVLYRKADTYFQHLVVQDKYIKVLNGLLDQYTLEVEKWDEIQAGHEGELQTLKDIITKRDKEITQLNKNKPIKKIENVTISDQAVDKLIAHLERTQDFPGTYNRDKVVKRAREMHNALHSFLQKLKAAAPQEVKDGE